MLQEIYLENIGTEDPVKEAVSSILFSSQYNLPIAQPAERHEVIRRFQEKTTTIFKNELYTQRKNDVEISIRRKINRDKEYQHHIYNLSCAIHELVMNEIEHAKSPYFTYTVFSKEPGLYVATADLGQGFDLEGELAEEARNFEQAINTLSKDRPIEARNEELEKIKTSNTVIKRHRGVGLTVITKMTDILYSHRTPDGRFTVTMGYNLEKLAQKFIDKYNPLPITSSSGGQ